MKNNVYDLNGNLVESTALTSSTSSTNKHRSAIANVLLQSIVMILLFIRPLVKFTCKILGCLGAISFVALFLLEPDIHNYSSLLYFSLGLSFISFLLRWVYDGFILKYSNANLILK